MPEARLADPRWTLLWCNGPDAVSFLGGMLSADLQVEAGTVRRSFLLQPQGKLIALLWLLIGEEEVGMVADTGVAQEVLDTLNRFRIRVDVEFSASPEPVRLVVGLAAVPAGEWRREDGGVVADVTRQGEERTIIVGPTGRVPAMTDEEYRVHRVRQGEPVVGIDVDAGTIPQETGLVPEAVSFTKGCYLGQELVARIDTRGHVNQRLMRVESPDGFEAGDEVHCEGRRAVVTTAVAVPGGTIGLAMVHRDVTGGQRVTIATTVGEVPGTVYDPGQ